MSSRPGSAQQNVGWDACRRLRSAAMLLATLIFAAVTVVVPAAAGCDDDDRPGAPHSLRATPLGSTGIMLQWSSNAGHYDIYIRDAKGRAVPEAPDITGGAPGRNYLEFYGLKPDKEYFFQIRARTEGGTQGCVSKNASDVVSAKTDTAELHNQCHNYTSRAMDNIAEMRRKGCELPGSSIEGRWATSEGTQFLFCMEQMRAGLNGDGNAQWLRNQDLYRCKVRADKCNAYRDSAVREAKINRDNNCGFKGPRWTLKGSDHYNWCMSSSTTQFRRTVEARTRHRENRICLEKKKAQGGGGAGGGGGSCPVPGDWSDMLAAHNELRGQYCGSPLTWDCGLAREAQKFAEECACGHSNAPGVGENLATKSVFPDAYPAGSDRDAFKDTWGCEKDLYDFNNPKIVGGFKENCKGPPEGSGVNGHFTQVVWKGNKQLGCGRARCPAKDKNCKVIPNGGFYTNWVCRYRGFDANGTSVGGNDSGKLAENVQRPPNCTTQKFHSRSAVSCVRGMVANSAGFCVCPPGKFWNGRVCTARARSSDPASPRPVPPPVTTSPRCPADRPNGTFPNCCPQNARFENGVCKQASSGGVGNTTSRREVCRSPRPVGTFPNCCPTGTFFSDGACRRPAGGGGANGTQPGGSKPRCAGDRPVGTYPNCCPTGMRFEGGACRRPAGSDGTNGTPATTTPTCTGARPVGTYPNCCPAGTRFEGGACRRPVNDGGTNAAQPGTGGQPRCTGDRPIGTYPNCCPAGTFFSNGKCSRPASPMPTPGTSTPAEVGTKACTGGRIGRPPHCRCPSGTRYLGGRCRRTPNPNPSQKVCPEGLTGPDCNKIIVR